MAVCETGGCLSGYSFRTVAVLFSLGLLTSSSYVLTSAIGVSLYLARIGAGSLPLILSVSAVIVVLVSALTYSVIVRVSTKACLFVAWVLLAMGSLTLSVYVQHSDHSLYVLGWIYVLAEIRGCLNTVFLTTLATDAFGAGTSKRPYVWVAAGAPIAGIVTGLILNYEASVITDVQYLRIIACLDVLVLIVAVFLPKTSRSISLANSNAADPAETGEPLGGSLSEASSSVVLRQKRLRFRSLLSLLIVAKAVVLTLVGFEWKLSVSEHLQGDETALISYFAVYYAVTDVLILGLQLLVAGKILDRFGSSLAILGYPVLLAVVAVLALATKTTFMLLVLITVARGMDVIRRAFHDPALSSAFSKLDEKLRLSGIIVAQGVFKPTAEVLTAIALLLAAPILNVHSVTAWWAIALAFWVLIAALTCRVSRDLA